MKKFLLLFILFAGLTSYAQEEDAPEVQIKDPEKPTASVDKHETPYTYISMLMQVIQIVREHYVDDDKVTYERLFRGAMKGVLHELDPFSAYEEPERFKHTVEENTGKFGGIGIVVSSKNNVLEVVSPVEDSPAFKEGIQSGDVIMEIDGKNTRMMNLNDCLKLLKGDPGTQVTLKIFRKSDESTRDFKLVRAVIKVSSVKGAKILDNGIGYVRITQFTETTGADLDKAIASLKEKGLKALIIDLRNNPGGLLIAAVDVCSRFMEKDELVVSTEGRTEKDSKKFVAKSSTKDLEIPLAVLINGYSASSSEIVAGCLQDSKRAVLIGERSFGKGSVQTLLPLQDKSALRLTTAKYYTPKKKVIHEVGIEPDIIVDVPMNQEAQIAYQIANFPGEIKPAAAKSIKDVQLERSVEILKGILLFNKKSGE